MKKISQNYKKVDKIEKKLYYNLIKYKIKTLLVGYSILIDPIRP